VVHNGKVVPAPLASGSDDVMAAVNLDLREATPVDPDGATGLGDSHIHRVRRHPSLPMFRQGYEYLETPDDPSAPLRAGLNFVGFQASPTPVVTVLRTDSWLGGTAFGGAPGSVTPVDFVTVRAAGLFAVPPAAASGEVPGLAAVWGG
jgi:hypothetical protein